MPSHVARSFSKRPALGWATTDDYDVVLVCTRCCCCALYRPGQHKTKKQPPPPADTGRWHTRHLIELFRRNPPNCCALLLAGSFYGALSMCATDWVMDWLLNRPLWAISGPLVLNGLNEFHPHTDRNKFISIGFFLVALKAVSLNMSTKRIFTYILNKAFKKCSRRQFDLVLQYQQN